MKDFEFKTNEYSQLSKKKEEYTYSTRAETIEEAIDNMYKTWHFKWTKEDIRGFLNG